MKYVVLPVDAPAASQSPMGRDGVVRRLSFYLAMEEYVARHTDEPDCFFMWQVKPSVIFGRNQVMQNEVNVDYCRKHGIEMYRRKSGGGCVYADEGNIMLSYITKEENSQQAFYTFVNMILLVLHKLGVTATSTSHNDVLIEGKKVSGTACYQLHGHNIVHGTLLYDTNMDHMLNAITPSAEKLEAKGIQSVHQRITFLKDYIDLGIDELKTFLRQTLCDGELLLKPDDIAAIEKLEQEYLRNEFIQKM